MEELAIYRSILIAGFVLAFILGVVASSSNWCTMGAISDWVNIGDKNRFRSWLMAIAVAMLGVTLMQSAGVIDLAMTTSNETANPPYRIANFVWLRYIVGGVIFGVGMTIASGCGNKTLLRLGAGNLKSIFVLLAISAGASLMIFTSFDYTVFLQWMMPLAINFADVGASGQDLGSIAAVISGSDDAELFNTLIGYGLGLLILAWVLKSADFRSDKQLVIAGLTVGLVVVGAWYFTAGPMGQQLLEEVEFLDARPYALGAQSFTFIAPAAHAYQFLQQGMQPEYFTFGLAAACGLFAGALVYSLVFRRFRLEWFHSVGDFFNHIVGGLLMGIGGVLAMGCTVGQAITGVSTLALGSFLTFASITLGSAVTMKYQYYRMLYEENSRKEALLTALVEVRMLPSSFRKLEAL